jgi:zinc D-Ala-D-Ala dipeptidase
MVLNMTKFFSLFFIFSSISVVWGFEQLSVVIAPEMNSTSGILQRYEKNGSWVKVGDPISVTLGRSGLGYADENEPQKHEGDGRSPLGLFSIDSSFGYSDTPNSKLPYYYADDSLICVDDVDDVRYNKMALLNRSNSPKSFEMMHRSDEVYTHGAVINYNSKAESGRGSCIFFHINNKAKKPTSGCSAMEEAPLLGLLRWFDPVKKPHLLQIPLSECGKYQKEFVGIECK